MPTAAPPVSFSSRPSHRLSQENFDVQVSLARNCFFLLVHSFLLTKWKMKDNPDLHGYTTFTEDSPFTILLRRSQPLNWFPRSAVSPQWWTSVPTRMGSCVRMSARCAQAFNFYAEYIMRNAGLDEAQAGIKIAGRNINNLRYADDTTLMAESEEELKSLLMKVKEESEKLA